MRLVRSAVVLLATCPSWAATGGDCIRDCAGVPTCDAEMADCLYDAGRVREAIARLKPVVASYPEETSYAHRLARAYLADDNPFWAQRVLQSALVARPDDCETRAWLAWVQLKQGLRGECENVLARSGCPRTAAERGRWALLRAYSASAADEGEPAGYLEEAGDAPELFAEDSELLDHLRRSADPEWINPLDLRVESAVGYTSNARAGLPLDRPADPDEPGPPSVIGRLDLIGRLVWPARGRVRPALDWALLGYALGDERARKYSFGQVWVRPGVILGRRLPRFLVAYKADVFLLPDRPSSSGATDASALYYQAHRAEIELETQRSVLYVGTGHRAINEPGRDRVEIDGGGGWSLVQSRSSLLVLGANARYQRAANLAYDLVGGTGLGVLRGNGPFGLTGQTTLSGGLDHYPSSADYFGTAEKRRDYLLGASAGVWSPRWNRVRIGLVYDYARRDSTANPDVQYDLREHRAMLKVRWSISLNPFAPPVHATEGRLALDYGLGEAELADERMREMLQQDDSDRRSSCGCGG